MVEIRTTHTLIKQAVAAAIGCWLLFSITAGCSKFNREGYLPEAGIALTFDDCYIDEWYQQINLFDSFQVKATFYISGYDKVTPEQKRKLHALQDHGHEIAYHTLTHPNLVQYLEQNTMQQLIEQEVNQGIMLMNRDGFYPTTFAYPYGRHTPKLDATLLQQFKSVRALNGTTDIAKSFTPVTGSEKMYAIGIDQSSGKTTRQLISFINTAYENSNCLVLVGHHIERPDTKMQVPVERLIELFKAAQDRHLRFYTISEISRD